MRTKWYILCIIFILIGVKCWAGDLITIFEPSFVKTKNPFLTISGKVDRSSISQIQLTVEPFLKRNKDDIYSSIIEVKEGYFQKGINLFSGLNIITIKTLDGKYETAKPIFLITPKEKMDKEKLGQKSPIVFTSPAEVKFTTYPIIKGVVTNPEIKEIMVIIMNFQTSLLLTEDVGVDILHKENFSDNITYKKVAVKNMTFSFPTVLGEGLNMIIARPVSKGAGIESIQYKVLVYEKTAKKIILEEPRLEKNRLLITGKVIDPSIKEVTVCIYALVEEVVKEKEYLKTIVDKRIKVEKDGSFKMTTKLETEHYIIKSSPTIVVIGGRERITKTLIKWW